MVLAAACGDGGGTITPADAGDGGGIPPRMFPDATPLPDVPPGSCTPVSGTPPLGLEAIATGLSQPIAIAFPRGETRFFVAEKGGRVRIIEDGRPRETDFLDLSGEVSDGSEQGLLGLAFHPRYDENRRFFVHYTNRGGDSRVVEYRASADPNVAETTGFEILAVDQPFPNHNGGHVLFTPDGYLTVGFGDGGSGYDPEGNGQDNTVRLGKILRLDVDVARPARFAIPAGNPFRDLGGAGPEIFVTGLRNPWRYGFDRATGDLWIGDVGQDAWEEIDVVPWGTSGQNFGWGVVEGNDHCPRDPELRCTLPGHDRPVLEYDHGDGLAIVGGTVYRGCRMPGHHGRYFYGDNSSGFVASFRWDGSAVRDPVVHDSLATPGLGTFGEDRDGELVLCSLSRGTCSRVVPR